MSSHKSKKRKVSHDQQSLRNGADPDTSKPTAVFVPTGGRSHTVSVALPGSIIANAQSHDQKTYLAGAIARALAVFCIDEVIIFEDDTKPRANSGKGSYYHDDDEADGYTAFSDPSHFLAHVLSFLETPPYMRKYLFPMHRNLRTAGALPSLDMPHHIRANEWCEYRDGVTVQDESQGEGPVSTTKKKKNKKQKQDSIDESSVTVIDTGLPQKVRLEGLSIPENTRVTVKFTSSDSNPQEAKPVAPSAPREEAGYYWGYNVRRCSSLSTVFTECPFDGGYDLSFGTSERGVDISSILSSSSSSNTSQPVPKSQHMLIVFGGVAGIEAAVKADSELLATGVRPGEAEKLFDYWVNVLPGQGSRTIRTEEAVWLGLMGLRGVVRRNEEGE
ncbi:hypothetical protein FQN54_004419 [Arachnomyces sp. PD_36]|nr:hypothetical protein FQN54_004419 [Arachnomyces sp. PD_36]